MPFIRGTILRTFPALILFGAALAASAQGGNAGVIRGTVTDPSGAVIPGATVHLTGDSATVDVRNTGDASTYHYTVIRSSEKGSWKLQKAWRTDPDGRTIEEFTVP